MSKNRKKIVEAIQSISAPREDTVMSGYVKEVDETKATMSVILNVSGQLVEGVLLHALGGSLKGMLVIPEQDSDVVICSVDGSGEYMLVQADKIKKVLLDISNIQAKVSDKIEINCDDIVFNGGNNGGFVIVSNLVDKLNGIEGKINTVIQKFETHVHTAPNGATSTALAAAPATTVTPPLQSTQLSDLENSKIQH